MIVKCSKCGRDVDTELEPVVTSTDGRKVCGRCYSGCNDDPHIPQSYL